MEQLENKELQMEEVNSINEEENNEKEYLKALEILNGYGLDWTFRSIEYTINKENISFGQLRSCVYVQDGNSVFNYIKSTLLLIKAGLVGSKQFKESDREALDNKAYEILEDWRSHFGYVGTLHLLIINQMETKHFFMATPDLAVINHLSYKNLQKDLGSNLIAEDLENKVRQAQALSTIY